MFEVQSYPTLILLGPDGQLVSSQARELVAQDPHAAKFPWTEKEEVPESLLSHEIRLLDFACHTTSLTATAEHREGRLGVAGLEQIHGLVNDIRLLSRGIPTLPEDHETFPPQLQASLTGRSRRFGGCWLLHGTGEERYAGATDNQPPAILADMLQVPDSEVQTLQEALQVVERCESIVHSLLSRAVGVGVTAGLALKHQVIQIFRQAYTIALPRPKPRSRLPAVDIDASAVSDAGQTVDDEPCIWASGGLTKAQQLKLLAQLSQAALVYGTVSWNWNLL